MSLWTQALIEARTAEARKAYDVANNIPWADLSSRDRALMDALGYLLLERDDISLAGLFDADLEEQK